MYLASNGFSIVFDKDKDPAPLFMVVPTWVPHAAFPCKRGGGAGGTTLFLMPDVGGGKSVGALQQQLWSFSATALCFLRKLRWVRIGLGQEASVAPIG